MPPEPARGLPTVQVTTVAGYLVPGLADGKGWEARFNGPAGIAAAPDGSLYVSDSRNHRLRRVAPDMTVTTVAGSGPADCQPGGFADGPAEQARLFNPSGLAVAKDGTVYFADSGNHRIRKLQNGTVTTVAGSQTPKDDLGYEQGGCLDGPAASAQFRFPAALAVDDSGAIWVADLGNGKLRRIANGAVTTVAAPIGLKQPTGLALGAGGTLLVADPSASGLLTVTGGSQLLARSRTGLVPKTPEAVCRCGAGWAVVDAEWDAVYLMGDTQSVLLAGELPEKPAPGFADGSGDRARFAWPCGVASVGARLFVCDFESNCIRALTVPPDCASWLAPQPAAGPEGR
jgi:hypothetical protein